MRVSHAHACTHTIPTEPCVPLDARETSLFYPQSSHFQSQPTALHTWTSGNRSEGCLGPVRPEEWQTLLPPKPTESPFTNMMVTNDTSLQNKSGIVLSHPNSLWPQPSEKLPAFLHLLASLTFVTSDTRLFLCAAHVLIFFCNFF